MAYELPKTIVARAMREVDAEIRTNHKRGQFDEGDPNHPKYNNGINYTTGQPATLFGYDTAEFMAKQYR
jgi:hypothetical protein